MHTYNLYTVKWKQVYTEWILVREYLEEQKLRNSDFKEAKELITRIKEL